MPKPCGEVHSAFEYCQECRDICDQREKEREEKKRLREGSITDLCQAFEYIEGVRSRLVNKGGVPVLSKEKRADLYFAGKYIILAIEQFGTGKDKQRIQDIIKEYENKFKD